MAIYPEFEERLRGAKDAFDKATTDNIIGLGGEYVALLDNYLRKLYDHPGAPGGNLMPGSSSSWDQVYKIRKAVEAAIHNTLETRNKISHLLNSFTEMRGYEATETLNNAKYKGHDNWELRNGLVRPGGPGSHVMTMQDAVETASRIRREQYISGRDAAKGATK